MKKYFVLADSLGIETFMEYNAYKKQHFPYLMRAMLNRHRDAIVFVVDLKKSHAKIISDVLKQDDYKLALKTLKMFAERTEGEIVFPPQRAEEFQVSYKKIPYDESEIKILRLGTNLKNKKLRSPKNDNNARNSDAPKIAKRAIK